MKQVGPAVADWTRVVPEIAVRLALGGQVQEQQSNGWVVCFEGKQFSVAAEAMSLARQVAALLSKPPLERLTASDVLDMRLAAEDAMLKLIMPEVGRVSVLFFPSALMASGYYRAKLPAALMRERSRAIAHWAANLDLAQACKFDVLWIQLQTAPMVYEIARRARERGVKIVFDIDDDFESVPEWSSVKSYFNPEQIARWWGMIELADVVTTSTRTLAEKVRPRARRVEVLPNCLAATIWPKPRERGDGIKRILWAGTPTHEKDLDLIAPAVSEILRDDQSVRFVCFGSRPPAALATHHAQVELVNFCEFEDYEDTLASIGADVALCPLVDIPFNRSKSAIKYLEMAATGYPVLASAVGEYPEIIVPGENGLLIGGAAAWRGAITAVLGGAYPRMGACGRDWVLAHRDIAKSAELWENLALSLKE